MGFLPLGNRWTPRRSSGLVRWGEVRALTGLNDGDAVTTYSDMLGVTANDFTQSAGNRPVYKANIFGSRPGLLFAAASSQSMRANGVATPLSGDDSAFTVYQLIKFRDVTIANNTWAAGSSTTANRYVRSQSAATTGVMTVARRGDADGAGTTLTSFFTFANAIAYVVAWSFSGTTISVDVNGANVLTNGAFDTAAVTLDRFVLGARMGAADASTNFLDGYIGADLLYTVAHTAAQRQRVYRYLRSLA